MNGNERKALLRLLEQARKPRTEPVFANIGGWRLGLSSGFPVSVAGWHLSASLYPKGRSSTDADWRFIGEATAILGAPNDALLTPFDTTPPGDVHHWQWGGSGEVREATRRALPAVKEEVRELVGTDGPCEGRRGGEDCGRPSSGAMACKFCDKRYAHCPAHEDGIRYLMSGHVLRVHPEKLPREHFVKLLDSPQMMRDLRRQQAEAPELWARFFEYVAEVQNGGAS